MLFKVLIAMAFAFTALPSAGTAQTFPSKPIRFIVPFPAGSATDGIARIVGEEMRKLLGQPVIVENKAGADGIVGAQAVAQAPPDGYTVLIATNSTHGVNTTLYKQLPYDAVKDFAAVGGVFIIAQMLCVRNDFPAGDIKGLIAAAQRRSKPMTFASGNTSSQVGGALLKEVTKLDLTHVPYRGSPQALTAVLSGEVDMVFSDPLAAKAMLDASQIKVLGVADKMRLHLLPNVPTFFEAGYPGFEVVSYSGMFAPARTDPAIVARLNAALVAALTNPEVKERIQVLGAVVMPTSSDELAAYLTKAIQFWGRMVEMAGIEKK